MSASSRIARAGALALALVLACPLVARATWPTDPAINLPVVVTAGNQASVVALRDPGGGVYVVWYDNRAYATQGFDVYVTHVLAAGAVDPAFPASGLAIAATTRGEQWGQPVADAGGGLVVAWAAEALSGSYDSDVLVHHVLAGGTLDPAWPAGGRALCLATGVQNEPSLVSDGASGALAVWTDARGGVEDLYAHHVRADGTLDPGWPADGRAVVTATGAQYNPHPLADGAGGLFVVWHDARSGTLDLYAHHVRADGTLDPAWPANGLAVCTASGGQGYPDVVTDGAGGMLVVWHDDRGTSRDIYAHHVLATGTVDPAWPANGRAVCTAAAAQDWPRPVSDGAGGAIVAWMDLRNGATHDLYAARVLAGGTLDAAWPVNGLAVCTAANEQWSPAVTSDLAGGALMTWQDRRTGGVEDLYALRVLPGGTLAPGWPVNGRVVSNAANGQVAPTLVSDGTGGGMVVWCDWRNGVDTDLYAMRVQSDGALGGDIAAVDPRAPSALALAPPRPHPARGGPLTVRFTLPRAGDAALELFDVAGRRLDTLALRSLAAGAHEARLGDASLRPGLHLVRLRHGGETRTLRVLVLE